MFVTEISRSPRAAASLKRRPVGHPPSLGACTKLADQVHRFFNPLQDERQRLYEEVRSLAARLNAKLGQWLELGGGWPPWPELQQSLDELQQLLDAVGAAPALSHHGKRKRGHPPQEWHAYAPVLAQLIKAALVDAGNDRLLAATNPESLVAGVGARFISRLFFHEHGGRNPKGRNPPLKISAATFADAVRPRSRGKKLSFEKYFPDAARVKVLK